jgi:hypothetical protein
VSVAALPRATASPAWLGRYVTEPSTAAAKANTTPTVIGHSQQAVPINIMPVMNNAVQKAVDGASPPAAMEEWEGLKNVFGEL